MSLLIPNPSQIFQNVRRVSELGANPDSRRQLARNMIQANLKRVHHGWSALANRVLGTTPVTVQLQFPPALPFRYRPGTTDLLVLEQVFLDQEYHVEPIAPESIEFIV